MKQITLKVDGMMCGMCESHVNEAVCKAFPKAKKVTSSHSKGQTVILTEGDIPEAALRAAMEPTGYEVLGYKEEPYQKKGLFGWLSK